MIIISQNKEKIINFDNIVEIKISDYGYNETNFTLVVEINERGIPIGQYLSMERAKEVLDGIIKFYTRLDLAEQEMPVDKAIATTLLRDRAAFWMPEE